MSAAIFVAEGTEEIEFSIAYDVLVRGGVKVTSVYVPAPGAPATPPNGLLTASRGVKLGYDTALSEFANSKSYEGVDALVVPGGVGGAKTISENTDVQSILAQAYKSGKIVAAVCAGSLAIKTAKIADGEPITSHPSVKDQLSGQYDYKDESVVVAKNLITSRGPGSSFAFALAIVQQLKGKEKRDEIAAPMMFEHL